MKTRRMLVLALSVSLVMPVVVAAQSSDDLKALRQEIESLKAGIGAVQRDVQDIKNLLQSLRQPAAPPSPVTPESMEMSLTDAHAKGGAGARLVLVEFSDFQCPFCGRVEPTIHQLEQKYEGKIHFAFKNYPLPFHNNAQGAAEAAEAAKAQGKFWQMHDKMFANQQALDRASLEKYAAQIGLNVDKFKADLDSGKYKSAIEAQTKEGSTIGVTGTPAVFINGRRISGAYPFDTFKKIADEELAKKQGKKRG